MLVFSEQSILNKRNIFEPEGENFWFQAVEIDPNENTGWYRAYGYIHYIGQETPKPAVLYFDPIFDDDEIEKTAEDFFAAPWRDWEVFENEDENE